MPTASAIIDRAMRIARVNAAPGRSFQNPTSQKVEALTVLNDLLGTYRLMSMVWYEITTNVHTLVVGLNPHPIGSGAALDQPRPVQILQAYLRYLPSSPDTDTRLIQLTVQQYASIAAKDIESQIPQYFYYDCAMRTTGSLTADRGNVYLWPIPSQANEIVIYTPVILTEPASLTTDMILPPGYGRMLSYNLAVELIPLYPKRINDPRADAAMVQNARESLYWVKVNNARPLDIQSDLAAVIPNRGGIWNYITGDYGNW